MLRDFRVADLFTLLNAFAGMGAILSFMRFCVEARMESFWLGTGLLPAALVMDVLDGRVGRIDVPGGEVLRLRRGPLDLPLSGAPDVLRAIYARTARDGPSGRRQG